MGPVESTPNNEAATKLVGLIESLSTEEQAAVVQIMGEVIRRTEAYPSALETSGVLSSWVRSGRDVDAGW